jgi:hypothetical protein
VTRTGRRPLPVARVSIKQKNKNKTPPTLLSAASKFVEALAAR